MTANSVEEIRKRLLRDDSVQEMIRARAYEIFLMRGVQPGGPAQDWFQAESEVLAFLLANQPEHTTEKVIEQASPVSAGDTSSESAKPEKTRKPRATSKSTAAKKTTHRTGGKKTPPSETKPKRARKKSTPDETTE